MRMTCGTDLESAETKTVTPDMRVASRSTRSTRASLYGETRGETVSLLDGLWLGGIGRSVGSAERSQDSRCDQAGEPEAAQEREVDLQSARRGRPRFGVADAAEVGACGWRQW